MGQGSNFRASGLELQALGQGLGELLLQRFVA